METYYQINGEDTLGILPKKVKRYDSPDIALKKLEQALKSKGIDDSHITHGMQAGLPYLYVIGFDSKYWISKETVQPVYVVIEEDESSLGGRDIHAMFDSELHAQQYLSELAYNSGTSFTFGGKPALTLVDGPNVLTYWIEKHEVEIYE